MEKTKAKGHEFKTFIVKDSFNRRAVQFRNAIIHTLKRIGITENDVDIQFEAYALKKMPASATWYFNGHMMYYSYEGAEKFVENLYVVSKVIELEVDAVINKKKSMEDFISAFSEDDDVEEQRKEARAVLGLPSNTKNLDLINKRYKTLARTHHPDTSTGDTEKFKVINRAHKMLRRELE